MIFSILPHHRQNLERLRDLLLQPEERVGFHMVRYVTLRDNDLPYNSEYAAQMSMTGEIYLDQNCAPCGTAACALGHSACFLEPLGPGEKFEPYASRMYGAGVYADDGGDSPGLLWDWLFSPTWAIYDNSRQGAARRIQWVLDGLNVPSDPFSEKVLRGIGYLPEQTDAGQA